MAEIVWTLGATQDFQRVFAQFEEHRPDAGIRFTEEVGAKLLHLAAFPHMGPIYDPPFRRLLVFGREYGVYYVVEPRGIIIHALLDCRRSPESTRRRLRDE
jgi:plasmid stabilization system protein ParE